MLTLNKPTLTITLHPSTADVDVKAVVTFDPSEVKFIKDYDVQLKLSCELLGDDSTSSDDDLYWFTSKTIDKSNIATTFTHHFKKTGMSRSVLDEDSWPSGDDEVYARVKLKSLSSVYSFSTKKKSSATVSGSY